MNLDTFNSLVGQDSYVRCIDKKRIDTAIVSEAAASNHLFSGGQIGWWVRSGYIVVDIDEGKEQALQIVKKLKLKTLMCQTPKGLHLYFKTTKDFPQKIGMVLPCGLKCDFRCAQKGYVILPFGTSDRKFNKTHQVAEMPLEFTPIPTRKDSLLGLKEGDGRNSTLFAHLMAYKNRGASNDQIDVMADIINNSVFAEPMPQTELEKIVKNTYKYEADSQGDNPYLLYSAKGAPIQVNARAVVDYFVNSGDIFVLGNDCYQYRNGIYEQASSHVRNTIRDMIMVDNLITQSRIMECYRLLIDDTRIRKDPSHLNSDENLINFTNGVWDINAKKLLPHDSKYLQTVQIPHEVKPYKPFVETRLYDFFMKTQLPKEDIKMLLRYMAYTMTLGVGFKAFMVLLGQSNTGKSVLIRFFEALIGQQNTSNLSMHELNMRFYPAQLYNKLLNSCADNSSLPLSSIESLKKITGKDMIMHEKKGDPNIFFFTPFAKLLFSFNQMPLQLEEKSNAFYRRMRILSMNNELFLNNAYVDDLCSKESVEETIPYLLSLLPLTEIPRTAKSDKLVEGLRRDSDTIHAFMTRCCVQKPDASISKEALYEAYAMYCVSTGREAHKKHNFMRNMRSQGLQETRDGRTREACWKGIRLKPERKNKKGGVD